jgi:hypothetical protein
VAVAVAASSSLSVRLNVRATALALMLMTMGCVEPTATSLRPAASAAVKEQTNSYSINPDRSIYVRLVRLRGEGVEPVHAFVQRVMDSADSADAQRLVVDLRSISGSDARLVVPLVTGIVIRDRFVGEGRLYVVVGPYSFTPTQNAAALLRQYAHAIFVTQPPAAAPIG